MRLINCVHCPLLALQVHYCFTGECVCVFSHQVLETAVQVCEVGVCVCKRQHSFLRQRALNIIVLQNHILLQNLHSEDLIGVVQAGQHHLHTRTHDGGQTFIQLLYNNEIIKTIKLF